ncbi:VCBS repeat-containing protein [Streptomyces sp. NBC_01410]|uniref:FG-GAP repeat domain-containing protein n=1 Tax=Streptomyces sp. NBC_01410 TaxID=2903856 RepID=UPI00324F21D2
MEINGDHWADSLKIFPDGSVRAALNTQGADGRIHWVDQGIIAPGVGQLGDSVRFADMNGDGLDDYLVVGSAGSMDAHIHIPNTLTGSKIDTFATGTKAGPRARMRLGDINGDRKIDYLVVGRTGAVHAYVNHMTGMSDGNWTQHKYFAKESFYPDTTVAFHDVTGDCRADYLVVQGGRIQAWENQGGDNLTP